MMKRFFDAIIPSSYANLFSLISILGILGCSQEADIVSNPPILFTLLDSSETGVHFSNDIKDDEERNILLYANFYGGAGVGIGDFNNDGLEDLFFAGNIVPDKLYLNKGNLEFEDVTDTSGIQNDGGWSTGVTLADVNNDGHLDIYVTRELYDNKPEWRTNLLYMNKGDGTFEESAEKFGVADDQRTRHATFFDFDKDGYLDLFLLTQPPNPGTYSEFKGTTLLKPEYHLKLMRNTGLGSFEDVSEKAGIDLVGFPNAVSASDVNNDGWPDLYVANDFYAPDFLFLNNQDGTFKNVAGDALSHTSYYSMGVDVADINNDAMLDVFVLDMVAEDNFRLKSNMSGMDRDAFWKVVSNGGGYQYMFNTVQLNNGNTTFSDVAQLTGMAATDWSWANLIADFDNDGLKDVYVTNGLLYDIRNTDADKAVAKLVNETTYNYLQNHPDGGAIESIWDILDIEEVVALLPSQPLKNYAFKNHGNLQFKKVIEEWGLDQASFSNGAAYADLDKDGDLDIVVNNIDREAFVYRNNSESFPNAQNFLKIELSDSRNRPVFGTRVALYHNGKTQIQETTNVRGIYSTSTHAVHFGLEKETKVDSIVVTWPDQKRTTLRDVYSNRILNLAMDKGKEIDRNPAVPSSETLFVDVTDSSDIQLKHVENEFDDFEKQVLLPHKLSQFGPALAKGDINNDGLEDVFVGGATGYNASLFVQKANGGFTKSSDNLWNQEADYEDVDATFVDIDSDGFQDLYVVSGGNAYPKNDPHYTDRLYINDRKGGFNKGAILKVDRISESTVIAEDYDQDGDQDLFVAGRHLPHEYPLPTSSMLLKNEGGQLINVTGDLAPEMESLGMVTDAVWTDFDSDGDSDLIVVGEWIPITLFENGYGRLKKRAADGLENSSGWWFSIEKGDFDKDGDDDFIVGNLGLNYKYQTSEEKPFDIYYDDFDSNGKSDIVLGYYNDNKHYPLRGFSCSAEQIPGLKENIGKYDVFASLELKEVYGEENLKNALHYEADTFASSYIENLGNGSFNITELPRMAQITNINDMLVKDFNNDGNPDVLAIGNLFVSEIETPRNDAGTGILLMGNGKGGFELVSSSESGFFTQGDAKNMVLLSHDRQPMVLVANNNDLLQSFTVRSN
jgi:hypothetical protein